MREIKFRALAPKIDGEWHYGSFIENTINDFDSYILENDGNATKVLIDRETVGQYTGLKDKNEKEIYEGDIVKVNNEIIAKVIWDKDYLGYFLYANEENSIDSFENGEQPLCDYFGSIEVIGNIYENLELLKEGESYEK